MLSLFKKSQSNEEDSNEKSNAIEKISADELSEILEEIKRENLDYSDEQIRKKGAPRKCKKAFKREEKPVDPESLLTELEKELKKMRNIMVITSNASFQRCCER